MKYRVEKFVRGYILYSTSKPSNLKLGLYMLLSVPSRPWESISMDFDRVFPMTHRGHDYLFILVDCFNKMCVLIPCKKTIFRPEEIELFFRHFWVHFGFPNSIIFDWDNRFLGIFRTMLLGNNGYQVEIFQLPFILRLMEKMRLLIERLCDCWETTKKNIQRLGTSN